MTLTNLFLPKLQTLAEQQSPTLLELIRMKSMRGTENALDPDYLRGAFAIIAEYYISGIDKGHIRFGDEYEKNEFFWMLRLIVDYTTGGKMEDLLPIDPAVKAKINDFIANAKQP